MNFSDLPEAARRHATMTRQSTVKKYSNNTEEFDIWCRLLETDVILMEAIRARLAMWAKRGDGMSEKIIGSTIGSMMGYGVESGRVMSVLNVVLYSSQGSVNP